MKKNIFMLLMLFAAVLFASCDKTQSYSKLKKKQQKELDKFISQRGIEVLHKYPSNGVFGEKQFYLTDKGVYINVVDSGNGNRPKIGKTIILMRCSGEDFFKVDTPKKFNFFANGVQPFEFKYGDVISTMERYKPDRQSPYYFFISPGIESALNHVGENSTVKLIVPFEEGSLYQYTAGAPLYYDKVTFKFD